VPIDPSTAFVSYSREDLEFVRRLVEDLKSKGAKIWMDKTDLHPGQDWPAEVEAAVDGCQRMIVVLSPAAAASRQVTNEFMAALEDGKIVIPVLFRDCKPPLQLRRLQYADFRSNYSSGIDELLASLRGERELTTGGAETQSNEAEQLEQQRITEQQAQLEQEREHILAEQARLDDEKRRAAAERARLEQLELKQRAAEETSKQTELDKQAVVKEKARLERQRKQIEADQARLNEEHKTAADEKRRLQQLQRKRSAGQARHKRAGLDGEEVIEQTKVRFEPVPVAPEPAEITHIEHSEIESQMPLQEKTAFDYLIYDRTLKMSKGDWLLWAIAVIVGLIGFIIWIAIKGG
jgi:hypothetical protein